MTVVSDGKHDNTRTKVTYSGRKVGMFRRELDPRSLLSPQRDASRFLRNSDEREDTSPRYLLLKLVHVPNFYNAIEIGVPFELPEASDVLRAPYRCLSVCVS